MAIYSVIQGTMQSNDTSSQLMCYQSEINPTSESVTFSIKKNSSSDITDDDDDDNNNKIH